MQHSSVILNVIFWDLWPWDFWMSLNWRYSSILLMQNNDGGKGLSEFTNVFLIFNSSFILFFVFKNLSAFCSRYWCFYSLWLSTVHREVQIMIKHGLKMGTWPPSEARYYSILIDWLICFLMTYNSIFKSKIDKMWIFKLCRQIMNTFFCRTIRMYKRFNTRIYLACTHGYCSIMGNSPRF